MSGNKLNWGLGISIFLHGFLMSIPVTVPDVREFREIELFVLEEKPVSIVKKLPANKSVKNPQTSSSPPLYQHPVTAEKKPGNQIVIAQQKEVPEKKQEEICKNIKSPIIGETPIPPPQEVLEEASKPQIAQLPQSALPAIQNEEIEKTHKEIEKPLLFSSQREISSSANSGAVEEETRLQTSSGQQRLPSSEEMLVGSEAGPRFRRREMPIYPPLAKRLGKEGKVVLRLTIDEKGNLQNVEVLAGAGYGFTEAAIEAVKRSKFLPAEKNGQPVAARAILPIRFTLRSSE